MDRSRVCAWRWNAAIAIVGILLLPAALEPPRPMDLIPNTVTVDRVAKYDQAGACGQTFAAIKWPHVTDDLPNRILLAIVNVHGTPANTWIRYADGKGTTST